MDSFELAKERFEATEDRMIRDGGFGATKNALAIIEKHISKATQVVHEKMLETSRPAIKDLIEAIYFVDERIIALVALQGAIDCICNEDDLNKTAHKLGGMLEREVYANDLKGFDKKLATKLDKSARRRGSSVKYRRTAVRSQAKKEGFKLKAWTKHEKVRAGMWLIEVIMALPEVFEVVQEAEGPQGPQSYLTLTQESLDYAQAMVSRLVDAHPVYLPLLSPPKPWEGHQLAIESNGRTYKVPMMRKTGLNLVYLKEAIAQGTMPGVLSGLSRAASVSWSINPRILEVLKASYVLGVEIDGLPLKADLKMPEKLPDEVWEAMDDEERRVRRMEIGELKQRNRSLIGERALYDRDVATAEWLLENGNRFWTLMNLDYRARVYGVPFFNYQRQDYVRGLFQYHRGKPLGAMGLYWLMVHLANCGDFEKVSKDTFDARIAWVEKHTDRLVSMVQDPLDDLWWTEADAPFCFLAAAMEYAEALKDPQGFVSHIPVSFDGTCSGLQHLAAMTRCERTAPLVNLTPNLKPADVYRTVAEALEVKVRAMAQEDNEFALVCQRALAYGIDRSLVKRNVMTYTYGAKKFGMTAQLMEDTMRPLQTKVVRKRIPEHPFQVPADTFENADGKTVVVPGRTAARLLGPMTFDTIEETVVRPAEAMKFLQKLSRALSHEGKPTVWHTPLGFPVVLHYPNTKAEAVRLWLYDRGVKVTQLRATIQEEAQGIDKVATANAIAPCFVHSYDACHLLMVINEAYEQGIEDIALVHDSFGCHAADAGRFRKIITDTFFRLYDENDVLEDILSEAFSQIHTNAYRLPLREEVSTGTYNLNDVKGSLYAFA